MLAPARDADVARQAILHGADAVYIGAPHHGARSSVGVAVADIAAVCDFAHRYDARVYATVNTLVYDDELPGVERMVRELWRAGIDALIVQDLSLLRMDLPPIALHASTQCDIRTPDKAAWLEALGFSQLVLARELSLAEIMAIRAATTVPLEAFVHGALCVCYSGRCAMSYMANGRSANRGECAQMCRLPYDLVDCEGKVLQRSQHLLSLRDLRLDAYVPAMIEAGVSSFKIEGRLKDEGYVKNVVAHYRDVLDRYINAHSGEVARASCGRVERTFEPAVERSFNRGFTTYFIDREHHRAPLPLSVACLSSPKARGEQVGVVRRATTRAVEIEPSVVVRNGDGISYTGADGEQLGFRVNRVSADGRVLSPFGMKVAPQPGTPLFRTRDKAMDDDLTGATAARRIAVVMSVSVTDGGVPVVTACDERGCEVRVAAEDVHVDPSRSDQSERQQRELTAVGEWYDLRCAGTCGDRFIPASVLSRLRREALAALDERWARVRTRPERTEPQCDVPCPARVLVSSDNVANRVAEQVYRDHGVQTITPAIEVQRGAVVYDATCPKVPLPVMTTRYCILRELGWCRAGNGAPTLREPLYLVHGEQRYRLRFDCAHCGMQVLLENND